jgi:hypothetical protein
MPLKENRERGLWWDERIAMKGARQTCSLSGAQTGYITNRYEYFQI